ncbi:MAG: hypothetical protein ABSA46_12325 [Thermodesulfovibrionales bacterium]|jgi:hypothetical protein
MKSLRAVFIFAVLVMTLLASGMASAASRGSGYAGGGHYGSYRGGYYGGYRGGYYGPYRGGYGYYWGRGGYYYGGGVGVVIGAPFGYPWWGYYPYGYYPYSGGYPYYAAPAVAAPSTPQVYVEPSQTQSSHQYGDSGVWYFCPDSRRYYPYVKACPGGWQTVPAQPPSEQ